MVPAGGAERRRQPGGIRTKNIHLWRYVALSQMSLRVYLRHMARFGRTGERIGYTVYPHADQAPPLVLIHGFTTSSASFAANIPALNERFTVITMDLLGHGQSDAPEDSAPYGPGPAIERILGLLNRLGYERVLLCGHSLGAALCLRLALEAPERLAGLVLINSMSAAGTPEWREGARPGMVEMAARLRTEGSGFLRSTRLYPAHSKRLDPQSRELLTRTFDEADPIGLAGTAERLVIDVNSYERVGELSVPTLLVIGTREEAFAAIAPEFVSRMPRGVARSVHLGEAGHAANLEQPDAFQSAVADFAVEIGYLPKRAAASTGSGRGGTVLTALGATLVVAGIGLLAGSFLFVKGGEDASRGPVRASASGPVATPTTVSLVAGTRSDGPVTGATFSTNQPANTAVAAPTTSPTNSPTVANSPTVLVPTPTATRAATTPPPTPPPTPTETAPATRPTGLSVSINGPATATLNVPVGFVSEVSGAVITGMSWSVTGGTHSAFNLAAPSVTFTQPGCQTVSLRVIFANGTTRGTTVRVAVGGESCP